MPVITSPVHQRGDFRVDYESALLEDDKAKSGEKALVTFHTAELDNCTRIINLLEAPRLSKKDLESSALLCGSCVTLSDRRDFPTPGNEAHPARLNVNNRTEKITCEGGNVYARRLALQAIYGLDGSAFIPGMILINQPDAIDPNPLNRSECAFVLHTRTLTGAQADNGINSSESRTSPDRHSAGRDSQRRGRSKIAYQ